MMFLTTILLSVVLAHRVSAGSPPAAPSGMQLTWSEDFSGSSLDTTNWNYADPSVHNNDEIQNYTQSNCKLSDSTLIITPVLTDGEWTSCRLESKGSWAPPENGKIQVQSKFKLGSSKNLQGIWPAFWSLGELMRTANVKWPACGEIDTFEAINGQATGHGTLHCGSSCEGSTGVAGETPFDYSAFHTWSHVIDTTSTNWADQSITFSLDGKEYKTIHGSDLGTEDSAKSDWEALATKAMYIILNVAVGGEWPGPPTSDTASGANANMVVDYVAVYSSTGSTDSTDSTAAIAATA